MMGAMHDTPTLIAWTQRLLVAIVVVPVLGCAQDYGRDNTTQPAPSSDTSTSGVTAAPTATPESQRGPSAPAGTTAQAREDARFVASEEEGNKVWKQAPAAAVISLKNRGNKPVLFKAVNMLPAEHGFAIDTMKVKEVLKPGEERTIAVALNNIDPTVSEHRVYCQLHPKHVAATLILAADQNPNLDTAKGAPKGQQGEAALRGPNDSSSSRGESEGQRTIREQSDKQRETTSTSPGAPGPGNFGSAPCEGFPGFDRGCPQGGK
jgi:hypothetical protein